MIHGIALQVSSAMLERGRIVTGGGGLTSWIWLNLPCGLRSLVDDYLNERRYLA